MAHYARMGKGCSRDDIRDDLYALDQFRGFGLTTPFWHLAQGHFVRGLRLAS
jgi:hypothetical protein